MNQLLIAIILTLLPITELRVGLPLALNYANNNSIPIMLVFLLIIIINVLLIVLILLFMDYAHHRLEKINIYRRGFEYWIKRIQKKIDKVEKKEGRLAYLLLYLFVAIPLPGTGAWTGTIIAWVLGLERKPAITAIALGIITAGIIVLLITLGIINSGIL